MNENNNDRTFTQDEVNRIVADRLKSERVKIMREADTRTAELDRREQLITTKSEWASKGLPVELLDALDLTKDGALETAERILQARTRTQRGGAEGMQDIGGVSEDSNLRAAFGLDRK